jgi:GH35 family endo-1,4-beta-xylanase
VKKLLFTSLFAAFLSCFAFKYSASAQFQGIDDSIARHRKGIITVKAEKDSRIVVEQLRHEFWFGCAIPNSLAGGMAEADLSRFKEKFLDLFNCAATENSLKWQVMERNSGEVNYAVTDAILKWCDDNNIPLRGHNIFWGKKQYIQPWLMNMSDSALMQALQQRGESVTNYYRGRFAEYDLNNEMLDENYYEERLGPEITSLMAKWALDGDPDALLFLNEHDVFVPEKPGGNKLARYMALIRTLLKQNVPIAGIAVQGHSHLETFDRQALRAGLDSLAIFKLPIRITEFNMPGRGYPSQDMRSVRLTPEQELEKAKELTDWYKICFAHPAVEGILMWGFWEGANWIPASSLYRRDWTATPAAEAYHNLVFNEWWTNVSGIADNSKEFSVPAFYGKYRITVNGVSKVVDLTRAQGKLDLDFIRLQ